jgi:hypothetical protein
MTMSGGRLGILFRQVLLYGALVECVRFTLDYADGIPGAVAQAGSQPVAEIIGGKDRLAVDYFDGAFRAGGDAESAAVTFVLVYMYDLSFHFGLLFLPWGSG